MKGAAGIATRGSCLPAAIRSKRFVPIEFASSGACGESRRQKLATEPEYHQACRESRATSPGCRSIAPDTSDQVGASAGDTHHAVDAGNRARCRPSGLDGTGKARTTLDSTGSEESPLLLVARFALAFGPFRAIRGNLVALDRLSLQ